MIDSEFSRRGLLRGVAGTAAAAGAIAATAPTAATATARGPKRTADTLVMNGKVLVLDRKGRRAQAVAIKNGRIVAVGSNREISRLAGRGTTVVDAAGGTVLPGINDSHFHFGSYGLSIPPYTYSLAAAGTVAAAQAVVAQAVADAKAAGKPAGSFIRANGLNESRLNAVGEKLTRFDIDAVSEGYHVVITEFSFHAVLVNSSVINLPEVQQRIAAAPAELQPYIEREGGELTGWFREGAMGIVSVAPPFTPEERAASLDVAIAAVHSLGITSLTDPGVGAGQVATYADKFRSGALTVRINAMIGGGRNPASLQQALAAAAPLPGVDPRFLRVGQVKLFADGVPTAARTAFLHEPYVGTDSRGSLTLDGATLDEQIDNLHAMIRTAIGAGYQVGTHATGDAAIDLVVQGYLAAMGRTWRRADLRHYVIHGDLTPRATLRQMALHDIGANFNATIKYLLGTDLYPVIGETRTDYQWPYRTALDLGVKVSSSSDAPVTPPSWLQGVAGAVTRKAQFGDGAIAGEAERISVTEALASYTRTPAWQDHAEDWKGTLEEGYAADLCVIDGDLLGTDPDELAGLSVGATLVGGDVVYDSGSSAAAATKAVAALTKGFSREQAKACLDGGMCCCRISEHTGALPNGNGRH